ncbi:hypothetical protein [uncultured phage cr130_1]|uniref:Stabilization protein n=1 Tax=uncultured phage cr130_1 TaxID=2772092 RepID=A0A7M1RVB3_9CAUD|nr:virion structural protein [uncultured phage cr130_1]QOR57629.1 hypothetical protein [uncultured phage cr130_1]
MDTNEQNKLSNIFINTFNGGMNSDTSFASMPSGQYSHAVNIRQINGKDYFDNNKALVEEKQGIISPITYKNKEIVFEGSGHEFLYILNTFTVNNKLIVLYKSRLRRRDGKDYYLISVATGQDEDKDDKYPGKILMNRKFSICDLDTPELYKDVKNISASIHRETDNIINLYICDGIHQLMLINISDNARLYISDISYISTHDYEYIIHTKYIQNNNYIPDKPIIMGQTSGNLKTGLVQYACILYKKHGIQSCLSLLTNKIQIISNNRTKKQGCAENTDSGIGIILKVEINDNYKKLFDMCKIYRIHYIKPGQNAEVYTICDTKISRDITYTDTGNSTLEKLKLEELQSTYSQRITPGVFTYNSLYGIVGDITDSTTISDIKNTSFLTYSLCIGKKEKEKTSLETFTIPDNPGYTYDNKAIYTIFKNDGLVIKYDLTDVQDYDGVRSGIINNYPGGDTGYRYLYRQHGRYEDIEIARIKSGESQLSRIFGYRCYARTDVMCTWGKYAGPTLPNEDFNDYITTYGHKLELFNEIDDNFLKNNKFCTIDTGTYYENPYDGHEHRYVYEYTHSKIKYGIFKVIGDDVNINKHNMGLFTFDYRVLSKLDNPTTKFNITGKYIYTDDNGDERVGYYGCNISKNGNIVLINSDKKLRHVGTGFWCKYKMVLDTSDTDAMMYGKFNITIGDKKLSVYFDTTLEYIIPPGYTVPCTCGGKPIDIIIDNVYANKDQVLKLIKKKYGEDDIVIMKGSDINKDLSPSEVENVVPFDKNGEIDPFNDYNNIVGGFSNCVLWRFIILNSLWRKTEEDTTVNDSSIEDKYYYLNKTRDGKYSLYDYSASGSVNGLIKEKGVQIKFPCDAGYNDIFVSSLFRTLMPGETYRYGIVFYNKEGKRSNVHWIADIKAPNILEDIYTSGIHNGKLPIIGIQFSVILTEQLIKNNICKYIIVRCKKRDIYTRILGLVVVSNVMRLDQLVNNGGDDISAENRLYSPYYSLGFITINNICIGLGYGIPPWPNGCYPGTGEVKQNVPKLYQLYSPEINHINDSIYTKITGSVQNMSVKYYIRSACDLLYADDNWGSDIHLDKKLNDVNRNDLAKGIFNVINRSKIKCRGAEKQSQYLYNYDIFNAGNVKYDTVELQKVNQVKELKWNDAFTEVKRNGTVVNDAIKKYTNFVLAVGSNSFVNFASFGKYDGDPGDDSSALFLFNFKWNTGISYNWKNFREYTWKDNNLHIEAYGPLCVGGRSFIALAKTPLTPLASLRYLCSYICDLTHEVQQFSGKTKDEMLYDIYYDFGNSVNIDKKNYVFDGLHYFQKYNIISAHKIYDFTDYYNNLQSTQIRNKIPMYSLVNEKLTYGEVNNDLFTSVEIQPYSLENLGAQENQAYEYASIYSDNDFSNSVFNAESYEESVVNFPQRIFYSNPKTNGENTDNWHIYKVANFIDGNDKLGRITDLFTYDNKTYVFLENGIGTLSINEKQTMQNTSGENIIIGTSDILKNINYISSSYGMRYMDMCKIGTSDAIYWFDYYNNCICQIKTKINSFDTLNCINYSSLTNVSNIINNYYDVQIKDGAEKRHILPPKIVFDNMRSELYFGNLKVNDLYYSIIFNTKYSFAQTLISEYTDAEVEKHKFLGFYNILGYVCKFELIDDGNYTNKGIIQKYSINRDNSDIQYLKPMSIQFVINNDTNSVKIFDNQLIQYSNRYGTDTLENNQFFKDRKLKVFTDMYKGESYVSDTDTFVTDREGSVCYPIPRTCDDKNTSTDVYMNEYGRRMRGRWMVETYTDLNPSKKSSIYNIITKTRKSYN